MVIQKSTTHYFLIASDRHNTREKGYIVQKSKKNEGLKTMIWTGKQNDYFFSPEIYLSASRKRFKLFFFKYSSIFNVLTLFG